MKQFINNIKILFFLICILFNSCAKINTNINDCKCGILKDISTDISSTECYHWVEMENNCSGNKKKFCLGYIFHPSGPYTQADVDTWMNNNTGKNFCIKDQESW